MMQTWLMSETGLIKVWTVAFTFTFLGNCSKSVPGVDPPITPARPMGR